MDSAASAAAREQVAAASRRLAAEGLVLGTAGNISARAGEHVAITPTGAELASLAADDVTVVALNGALVAGPPPPPPGGGPPPGAELPSLAADDVTVVALTGALVAGTLAPTWEVALPLGVYRRYDAGAVVHTHAPMATALSCVLEDELPCVHYGMLALGGSVPVAPYRTFGTAELAQVVLDALEGKTAALMANHGAIAWAADMDKAVEQSLLLEWACGVYWRAAQVGTPRPLSAGHQQDVVAAALERSYGTTKQLEGE